MNAPLSNLRSLWRRLSRVDVVALLLAIIGGTAYFLEAEGRVLNFLKFVGVISAIYLVYRLAAWGRNRLLWSLRNRLVVAGLFIALVPVLLLVILAIRSADILYSQLAAYLLYEDVQRRKDMLADIAKHIAAAHEALPPRITESEGEEILARQSHAVHDSELPGLSISFSDDATMLEKLTRGKGSFAGLLQQQKDQQNDELSIVAMQAIHDSKRLRVVRLQVPVDGVF